MTNPGRLVGIVALAASAMGCYTLQPIRGVEPKVGSSVAFDVNDAGRVALGGTMGPEIAQVEGQLVEKDNEGFLLAVSTVRLLRGGEQSWTGEKVRLNPTHLGTAYAREFSLGRTLAMSALSIGAVGAVILTRSLVGSGNDDDGGGGPPVDARLGRP